MAEPKLKYAAITFANGRFGVYLDAPDMKVRTVRRAEHGDWRTQLSRDYFMGVDAGQECHLIGIVENMYGSWCRVVFDGKTSDVSPLDLEVVK